MRAEQSYQVFGCRTVAAIQKKIAERGKQSLTSRLFCAKNAKDVIAAWRQELMNALHIFNVCSFSRFSLVFANIFQTELVVNTHMMVMNIHDNMLSGQEGFHGQNPPASGIFRTPIRGCLPSPSPKRAQRQ